MLATDHIQTIVVFSYDDIEWGERAQIGFNAGDGHAFFMLPGALTDETINMDENTNVGEPGVFVYRIDSKCIYIVILPLNSKTQLSYIIFCLMFADLGLVECSTTTNCLGPTLGMMTIKKCCTGNREGLAYTSPGSNECHVCIGMYTVFSFLM